MWQIRSVSAVFWGSDYAASPSFCVSLLSEVITYALNKNCHKNIARVDEALSFFSVKIFRN